MGCRFSNCNCSACRSDVSFSFYLDFFIFFLPNCDCFFYYINKRASIVTSKCKRPSFQTRSQRAWRLNASKTGRTKSSYLIWIQSKKRKKKKRKKGQNDGDDKENKTITRIPNQNKESGKQINSRWTKNNKRERERKKHTAQKWTESVKVAVVTNKSSITDSIGVELWMCRRFFIYKKKNNNKQLSTWPLSNPPDHRHVFNAVDRNRVHFFFHNDFFFTPIFFRRFRRKELDPPFFSRILN